MRVVSPGVAGVVVATAVAAVLLSACNLREGDSSEYSGDRGRHGSNAGNITDQESLGKSSVSG
jgi:hypothetical protein